MTASNAMKWENGIDKKIIGIPKASIIPIIRNFAPCFRPTYKQIPARDN